MRIRTWLLLGVLMTAGRIAPAADIVIQGVFTDKALLQIDGNKRMLSVGQTSPEGVKLISAGGDAIEIEVNGRRSVQQMGAALSITSDYAERKSEDVRLWPDARGMYTTEGAINGMPMKFIVDTGATLISMNRSDARRLGIDYLKGRPISLSTASAIETGYMVSLSTVRVGAIQLHNVDAVVHQNASFPPQALLGMSFLGRLDMQREGAELRLKKKF
ncbi:MAG: retropepsin-like aspartic protease [Pseudomonadota bacterium]